MKKTDKSVILVVDDKSANILVLENLLAGKDRMFLNATSGEDALKITLNKDIDLIILDVQMPDMNGFEVAQILKSNKRTKNIPIIFATAESKERKFIMKGYDEGAIDYLFKPLDPEIVKAKVSVLLKIQLQKKELVEINHPTNSSMINEIGTMLRRRLSAIFQTDKMLSGFLCSLLSAPSTMGKTQAPICQSPRIQRWRRCISTLYLAGYSSYNCTSLTKPLRE